MTSNNSPLAGIGLNVATKCGFGITHYTEDIIRLIKKEYQPSFFSQKPDHKTRRLYLRHDIDIDIEKAAQIARIECEKGIAATYFLQLTSDLYNPLSKKNQAAVKIILLAGHELGLHFDHRIIEKTNRSFKDEIKNQFEILERYFPVRRVVSFHKPQGLAGKDVDLGQGIINVYGPDFFHADGVLIKYFSDSMGRWRQGCICQKLNPEKYKNIQLLFHPVWWGASAKSGDNFNGYTKLLGRKLENNIFSEAWE